jgi:hypothetical protein
MLSRFQAEWQPVGVRQTRRNNNLRRKKGRPDDLLKFP